MRQIKMHFRLRTSTVLLAILVTLGGLYILRQNSTSPINRPVGDSQGKVVAHEQQAKSIRIASLKSPNAPAFRQIMEKGVWNELCLDPDFFEYAVERNPSMAVKMFSNAPSEGDQKLRALNLLVRAWFRIDPVAFCDWLKTSEVPKEAAMKAFSQFADGMSDPSEWLSPKYYLNAVALNGDYFEKGEIQFMTETIKRGFLDSLCPSQTSAELVASLRRDAVDDWVESALALRAATNPEDVDAYCSKNDKLFTDFVRRAVLLGMIENRGAESGLRYYEEHDWSNLDLNRNAAELVMWSYLDTDSISASESIAALERGEKRDLLIKAMISWLQKKGAVEDANRWSAELSKK